MNFILLIQLAFPVLGFVISWYTESKYIGLTFEHSGMFYDRVTKVCPKVIVKISGTYLLPVNSTVL